MNAVYYIIMPGLLRYAAQNTGKTYSQLIRELRIRQAKKYLRNTNLKIGEIAERIGYHSADHFTSVFRSETEMSPSAWRKLI